MQSRKSRELENILKFVALNKYENNTRGRYTHLRDEVLFWLELSCWRYERNLKENAQDLILNVKRFKITFLGHFPWNNL